MCHKKVKLEPYSGIIFHGRITHGGAAYSATNHRVHFYLCGPNLQRTRDEKRRRILDTPSVINNVNALATVDHDDVRNVPRLQHYGQVFTWKTTEFELNSGDFFDYVEIKGKHARRLQVVATKYEDSRFMFAVMDEEGNHAWLHYLNDGKLSCEGLEDLGLPKIRLLQRKE